MPLPPRKTVKGPGLFLSPCFRFGVTGGQPSERQMLCRPQLPCMLAAIRESPGCLHGHQGWESICHSGATHGWVEHQWVGGSQPVAGTLASMVWGARSRRRLACRIQQCFQRAKWARGFSVVFPLPSLSSHL